MHRHDVLDFLATARSAKWFQLRMHSQLWRRGVGFAEHPSSEGCLEKKSNFCFVSWGPLPTPTAEGTRSKLRYESGSWKCIHFCFYWSIATSSFKLKSDIRPTFPRLGLFDPYVCMDFEILDRKYCLVYFQTPFNVAGECKSFLFSWCEFTETIEIISRYILYGFVVELTPYGLEFNI